MPGELNKPKLKIDGSSTSAGSDFANPERVIQASSLETFEADYESIPDESGDPDFPVLAYCILSVILITWGVVGFTLTVYLQRSHYAYEEFLLVDPKKLFLPASILYICTSICILAGTVAIICIAFESAAFFPVLPHLNGLVLGLNCMASACAYDGWTTGNIYAYQHLLEADTVLRATGDNSYLKIFGSQYIHFWDKLQTAFHCCGLEDPANWINSSCKCIPNSCCDFASKSICVNRLAEFHSSTSSNYKNFQYIQKHLWKINCMTAINEEISGLRRDWVSFPLILLIFHLILMLNINYIVVAARTRYNVPGGFMAINRLRESIKTKFKDLLSQRKQKVGI